MINILIADDNKELLITLASILAKIDNTKIINLSVNGQEAYHNIITFKPDIILLDLNMPKMNGIDILNNINIINDYHPKIIVISGYPEMIEQIKNRENIHMLFVKGQSLSKIISFIDQCALDETNKKDEIKVLIEALNTLHFNIGTKGCKYIMEAVLLIHDNPNLLDNMEGRVFQIVAKRNQTTVNKVKWNIIRCVNSMCKYSSKREICEYFKLMDYAKPTPKFVITYLSNLL